MKHASPPSGSTLACSTGTHRAKGASSPSQAPRGLGGAALWSHGSLALCASPAKWGQRGSQQPGLLGGLNELTSVKCLARGQDSVNPCDFNARDDKEVFVAQARENTRCCPCAVDPVGWQVVKSHACFPGRLGSCVRKQRLQGSTCASADDCASAASVDAVGARTLRWGPCIFYVSPREQGPWPPVGGGMGSRPWLLCAVLFLASNFRFCFLDPGQCLVPTCWGHLGRAFPSCGGTPSLLLFPDGRL